MGHARTHLVDPLPLLDPEARAGGGVVGPRVDVEEDEELLRVVDGRVELLLQVQDLGGVLSFVGGAWLMTSARMDLGQRTGTRDYHHHHSPSDLGVGDEEHHVRHARGHEVPGRVPLPVRLVQHDLCILCDART